jgi:cell division protein ZapA (FtsZ GTPase activity inhibitor)
MKELSITVNIANRKYKITVNENEEEYVRKAAAIIDKKIKDYAMQYEHKDLQDLLTIIALEYTTNATIMETQINFSNTELIEKLTKINTVLDEQIDSII